MANRNEFPDINERLRGINKPFVAKRDQKIFKTSSNKILSFGSLPPIVTREDADRRILYEKNRNANGASASGIAFTLGSIILLSTGHIITGGLFGVGAVVAFVIWRSIKKIKPLQKSHQH